MRIVNLGAAVLLAGALSACATTFTGEAHVEGGPSGCQAKCQAWGQELVGMVAMGEYSDACICRVPGKQVSVSDVAPVVGGTVGVALQMRRGQQQSAQMHQAH